MAGSFCPASVCPASVCPAFHRITMGKVQGSYGPKRDAVIHEFFKKRASSGFPVQRLFS